jgi:hypothetical protein
MTMAPELSPRGGGEREAQATESVGNELETPEADGFAEVKTFTW